MNKELTSRTAKDLSAEPPRSIRIRIGGYSILARTLDKGRADLVGKVGEYHFNCPLDNRLFSFKGVTGEEVRTLLIAGKSDEEIATWLTTHGIPKSTEEIALWSDGIEAFSYANDPEERAWFIGECISLGLDPATTTLSDFLEANDRLSFAT
jgi:hypothetical protein